MAMAGKIKLFSIFMSGVALSLAPMAEAGVSTSAAVIADIFNVYCAICVALCFTQGN